MPVIVKSVVLYIDSRVGGSGLQPTRIGHALLKLHGPRLSFPESLMALVMFSKDSLV